MLLVGLTGVSLAGILIQPDGGSPADALAVMMFAVVLIGLTSLWPPVSVIVLVTVPAAVWMADLFPPDTVLWLTSGLVVMWPGARLVRFRSW